MFDNFYQVSHRLASCKKIKKAHLIIIADTYSFNSMGMVNYKSQATIARECGVSVRTVNSAIKELRELGILRASETAFKETLKLTVNKQALFDYIAANEATEVRKSFNNSTSEDKQILQDLGWADHDTQNLHTDTQNLRNPYAEIADKKNTDNNTYKNTLTPEQICKQNLNSKDFLKEDSCREENRYFVDQLDDVHFPLCIAAVEVLNDIKNQGHAVYCGSYTIEDWSDMEDRLNELIHEDAFCDCRETPHQREAIVESFIVGTFNKRIISSGKETSLKHMTGLIRHMGATAVVDVNNADLCNLDY